MEATRISTTEEFEKMIKKGVTLVDFNAPWCAPCRSQEPILKELSSHFKGKARIGAINIDQHQHLARKYDIQSIPTLIIFKKNKEIQRFVGLQPELILSEALTNALYLLSPNLPPG